MKTESVNLNQIAATDETRSRPLNPEVVAEYCELLKVDAEFPPVDLFDDGQGHLRLADGFHRFAAAQKVGKLTILANVHEGGRIEALKHALGANAEHGYRRTAAEKRYAVRKALGEFQDFSDRMIADLCKVSPTFVGKVRTEVDPSTVHVDSEAISTETKRRGKDGVDRRMPRRAAKPQAAGPFTPSETPTPGIQSVAHSHEEAASQPSSTNSEREFAAFCETCAKVVPMALSITVANPGMKSRVRTRLNELREQIEAFHKTSLPKKHQEAPKEALTENEPWMVDLQAQFPIQKAAA